MTRAPQPIRFRYLPPKGDFAPIATINTTPLVDVMLVLLIMFIMIIPVLNHEVSIDLPSDGPAAPQPIHRLDIAAGGGLFWDGAPVSAAALAPRLAALAADPARPALHLNAHAEARYELVDEVLAMVRRAGVTRLGFVNNQQFARAF